MKPFVSIAAVTATVTALAVAPVLSQAQSASTAPDGTTMAHKRSHIKARSGQRPPGWRASGYDQASADSASSNTSMTDASSAAPLQGYPATTPIPPTLRPADLYGHNASGTGGKTMYPDQKSPSATNPRTVPLPEQPVPDPLCAPRAGSTLPQPNCASDSQSSTSTSSADSRAPDR